MTTDRLPCTEFSASSRFFRERHEALASDRVAALGEFVSECMASSQAELGNAAATCFVENIAGEPCDCELARHLTGEARRYYRAWGGRA
jgi:hypothetical protein